MTDTPPPEPTSHQGPRLGDEDEVRFTLRAPAYLFSLIDEFRGRRPGKISRNTWILEAITEKLKRERQAP